MAEEEESFALAAVIPVEPHRNRLIVDGYLLFCICVFG